MNTPTTAAQCNVLRYKRPEAAVAEAARKSRFTLRLEGSLAAVVTLAPVIPIFPGLAFLPPHRAASVRRKFRPALA